MLRVSSSVILAIVVLAIVVLAAKKHDDLTRTDRNISAATRTPWWHTECDESLLCRFLVNFLVPRFGRVTIKQAGEVHS